MKLALCTIVLLGACSSELASPDALPHDTYYSQNAVIGQCGDEPPAWCIPKLSLCANGGFAFLQGDVITEGTYHLEDQLAVATSNLDARGFTFDLSSRVMQEDGNTVLSPPWDVVQFVGDVNCTYNTP